MGRSSMNFAAFGFGVGCTSVTRKGMRRAWPIPQTKNIPITQINASHDLPDFFEFAGQPRRRRGAYHSRTNRGAGELPDLSTSARFADRPRFAATAQRSDFASNQKVIRSASRPNECLRLTPLLRPIHCPILRRLAIPVAFV